MSFIAIIMTPSIVFRQKLRESVRKNYCPVSIQMHLTFVYVILLNQTGMIRNTNMFRWEHKRKYEHNENVNVKNEMKT